MSKHQITFRCKQCMREITVRRSQAGKTVRCIACYTTQTVPEQSSVLPDESTLYGLNDASKPAVVYLTVICPVCHTRITEGDDMRGKEAECPECGKKVMMPKTPIVDPQAADLTTRITTTEVYDVRVDSPAVDAGPESVIDPQSSPAASSSSQLQPPATPQPRQIPVKCKLCETLMWADPSQVGHKVHCPDCDTETLVRAVTDPGEAIVAGSQSFEGSTHFGVADDEKPFDPTKPLIRLTCRLCATMMYATVDEIGSGKQCPDCATMTPVPDVEPTYYGRPNEHAPDLEDGTYGIGAPIVTPEIRVFGLTGELPRKIDQSNSDAKTGNQSSGDKIGEHDDTINRNLADQLNDRPASALDPATKMDIDHQATSSNVHRVRLPDHPMTRGVLQFYRSPGMFYVFVVQLFVSVIAGALLAKGIVISNEAFSTNNPIGGVMGLLFTAPGGFLGIWCAVSLGIHCLVILQETIEGVDRIEEMPLPEFMNWVVEVVRMQAMPMLLCGAPGWLLATFAFHTGTSVMTLASIYLFFPVVMLSTLQADTPLEPISLHVLKTIFYRPATWLTFYGQTLLILGVLTAITAALALIGPVTATLTAPLWLAGIMLYYRLLGRLGWVCNEALRDRAAAQSDNA